MGTAADRLVEARTRAGYDSAKDAAARVGVPYYTYVQHENGTRGISKDKAATYGRAFNVDPSWLLYGKGKPTVEGVPLVGYVGAGAEAHFYLPADLGEVPAPDGATSHTVAVEIRGTSLGPLFETWLVYYDEVRTPVTIDMIGRLCVVGLIDDKVLVKRLRASKTPGLYHLESNTEPTMFDQEVVWAAVVRSMSPR